MSAGVTIVWWRDIPAQVIVRNGRASARRELPRRFIEAIDRAAMGAGLAEADDYLEQWRRTGPDPCEADLEAEADRTAAALDARFTPEVLRSLAENGGHLTG